MKNKISVRVYIFLSLLGICTQLFSQHSELKQLENAYQNQNNDSLRLFFLNWEREYKPISMEDWMQLSDTVQDVYEIYYDFFNPFNLSRLLDYSSCWDSNYLDVQYLILPAQIEYGFVKNFDEAYLVSCIAKNESKNLFQYYKRKKYVLLYSEVKMYLKYKKMYHTKIDTLFNFYPNISDKKCKVLYFSNKYKQITDVFFNNDTTGFKDEYRSGYLMKKEEKWNRMVWVSPFIKTAKTHDFFNVLLLSFPEIKIIYFNEKRDQAIIYFYISYAMGETIYVKENNKWKFKSSKIINVY